MTKIFVHVNKKIGKNEIGSSTVWLVGHLPFSVGQPTPLK
jgi:hypothetical protein